MGMDSRLVRLQVLREQSRGRPERPAVRRHTCSPRRQHARSCFAWRCLDRISGGREGFLSLLVHSVFAGFEYRVPMCFRRELATKGTKGPFAASCLVAVLPKDSIAKRWKCFCHSPHLLTRQSG